MNVEARLAIAFAARIYINENVDEDLDQIFAL